MTSGGLPPFGDFKMDDVLTQAWLLDPLANAAKHSVKAATIDWEVFHEFAKNQSDIRKEWQRVLLMEPSVVAVAGLFLLCAVAALMFGCCFVCFGVLLGCCRGTLTAEEIREQNIWEFLALLLVVWIILIILSVLAVVMVFCILRMEWTYNLAIQSANDTVNDTATFMDDVQKQLHYLIDHSQEDYFMQKTSGIQLRLKSDVSDALGPFTNNFTNSLSRYRSACSDLENIIQETSTVLEQTVQRVNEARLKLGTLAGATQILKDECISNGYYSSCEDLPSSAEFPDPISHVNLEDLRQLSDESPEEYLIAARTVVPSGSDTAIAVMLTEELPEDFVKELHAKLSEISPELAELVKAGLHEFSNDIGVHFGNIQEHIETLEPYFVYHLNISKPYLQKAEWSAYGVTSLVMIVVSIVFLGLTCGFQGLLIPTIRGLRSDMTLRGYCLLRGSVVLTSFVMFIYCAAASGLYCINSPLEMICKTLDNMELFDEIIDNSTYFSFDKDIFEVKDFAEPGPTIKSILMNCQNSSSIFEALSLNMDQQIENVRSSVASAGTFDKILIDGIGSSVVQTYTDFQPVVDDLQRSVLLDLNERAKSYSALQSEKRNNLLLNAEKMGQLQNLVTNLGIIAASLQSSNYEDAAIEYERQANETRDCLTFLSADLKPLLGSLELQWEKTSQQLSVIADYGSKLDVDSQRLSNAVNVLGPETYGKFTESLKNEIKSWEYELLSHIGDQLLNEVGRCDAIWNIYKGLVGVPCHHFANCLNALWLLLVLATTFMLFNVIATSHLNHHFRKPDNGKEFLYELEEKEREDVEIANAVEQQMIEMEIADRIAREAAESKKKEKELLEKAEDQKGINKLKLKHLDKLHKKKPVILSSRTQAVIDKYKKYKESLIPEVPQ